MSGLMTNAVCGGLIGAGVTAFREAHRDPPPSVALGGARSAAMGVVCGAVSAAVGPVGVVGSAYFAIVAAAISFAKHG